MTAAPIDTDARPGEVSTAVRHALRRLGFYLRRNGGFYSLCVVFILIYNAAFVAIPVLVGRVVAAAESDPWLTGSSPGGDRRRGPPGCWPW